MADNNVSVTFSARVDDFVGAIGEARSALERFKSPFSDLETQFSTLRGAMSGAFDPSSVRAFDAALGSTKSLQASLSADYAQAADAMRRQDQASFDDATRAAKMAIGENVRDLERALRDRLATYAEDASNHQISEGDKVAASKRAIDEIGAAENQLYSLEASLSGRSATAREAIQIQAERSAQQHQQKIVAIQRDALAQQNQDYDSFFGSITRAFDSQLNGLLRGTTNWRDAFRNISEQLTVDFIRHVEQTVTRYAAGEAAKTSAAVSGASARVAADQSASGAGLAAQGAAIIRSILSSAAQAFAGVFGFLAPFMGPAAAGPAFAAQGEVAAATGAVASADIGMWSVPQDMLTLIHHNELVMPAAQAEAFRGLLSSGDAESSKSSAVHIHPTTNFHVSALDSGSVHQWVRSNSASMLKAVDEAVRHGAHLGLRRLGA